MDTSALWQAFAAGDATAREQARERLLTEHLGLVHYVAKQVARGLSTEADFDELVSAGTIGLVQALEGFDAARGLAFSTFAAPRIRGAMLDELRRQDHVPRSVRRKAREIGQAREALTRLLNRMPEPSELANQLGVDLETLWRWEGDVNGATRVSIERRAGADGDGPRPMDVIVDDDSLDVEEHITHGQEAELLRDAILKLGEQERTVLALYYYEELKLSEIATVLGVTESRVSQIRSKALSRLRTRLAPLRGQAA